MKTVRDALNAMLEKAGVKSPSELNDAQYAIYLRSTTFGLKIKSPVGCENPLEEAQITDDEYQHMLFEFQVACAG